MTQDLAFADAAAMRPISVLKTRLKPFSIGHEILLQNQRNAFAVLDEKEFSELSASEQRLSVIRAILICCQTWEENKHPHKWMRLWSWRVKRENFELAIADFRNYRYSGSSFPRFSESAEKEEGRKLGGSMLASVLKCVNFDYDFPYGAALHIYFSHAEKTGGCSIENDAERQLREMTEEILAEQKSRKEATCPA